MSDSVLRAYAEREAWARGLCQFSAGLVPDLLQTREYTDGVLAVRGITGSRADDAGGDIRYRQGLAERRLLSRTFLLDESALWRRVPGPGVMAGQLGHLYVMAQQPMVTIRVIPFARGPLQCERSFTLLAPGPAVYAEETAPGIGDALLFTEDYNGLMGRYEAAWKYLEATALNPEESLEMIDALTK